ncbi:MAG TPA: ABC transporter permease [Patescibacteria group bacterium]|nr:ABC transporter permease [Patescibacteria group bacterium]
MVEIKECFQLALRNLKSRPFRSWLTIIGIIIGVFLIISLISLSEGLKDTIMMQLRMMGSDLIIVMPGEMADIFMAMIGGMELSDEDIRTIERTRGVETVVVYPYASEVARHEGIAKITFLCGISFDKASAVLKEDMGWQTAEGDYPRSGRREVLIGNFVSKDVFPGIEVGDEISIKGRKFSVAGILKSLGNKQDDSMIILDLEDFRAVTGKREGTPAAMVKVTPGFNVETVAEDIKEALEQTGKRRLGEDAPAYSVLTSESVSDMVESVMAILQVVIFAFASIALVVGGIGIMNTMYTSVRERTREIGIMKAVGAKNSTVLAIFLFESGIIGIIGGLGGTLLGIVLAKSVELYGRAHPMFYITASVSPGLILFGLFFSMLVGSLSGFFPARKAAKLKPVESLRHHE